MDGDEPQQRMKRRQLLKAGVALAALSAVSHLKGIIPPFRTESWPISPSQLPEDPHSLLIMLVGEDRGSEKLVNGTAYNDMVGTSELTLKVRPAIARVLTSDPGEAVWEICGQIQRQIGNSGGSLHTLMIAGDSQTNQMAVSEPVPESVLTTLQNQSQQYIETHYGQVVPGKYFALMDVRTMLASFYFLQQATFQNHQAGEPLAKLIFLQGCDVAADLDKPDASFYLAMASAMKTPIIAATTAIGFNGVTPDGAYFVQFNPNGTLTRPSVNNPAGYQQGCDQQCENPALNEQWLHYFKNSLQAGGAGKKSAALGAGDEVTPDLFAAAALFKVGSKGVSTDRSPASASATEESRRAFLRKALIFPQR